MFTYLDEELLDELEKIPSTNNRIEGGVNARLREKLEKSLSCWGDAVVWEELHRSTKYPYYWD